MRSDHQLLRASLRKLGTANDAADVVAQLADAALARGVSGCVVELLAPRDVRYVAHVEPARVADGRTARGDERLESSILATAALTKLEPQHVRAAGHDDPFERVRQAWGADEIALVPIAHDGGARGVIAMFGRRIALEHVGMVELLAAAAADSLERLALTASLRAELRARETALAVLTSLAEHAPLPQVFVDRSLNLVAANEAFARMVARSHDSVFGLSLEALGVPGLARLRTAIPRAIARNSAERFDLTEAGRAFVMTVHPVADAEGAGITFVDVTALHAVVVQSRAIADAAILIGVSGDLTTAIDVFTGTCARTLGDAAITMRRSGEVEARAGDERLRLDAVARELLERDLARGPARALRTGTADALSVDDLALLGVAAPFHLMALPLRGRDGDRVELIARQASRPPFSAHDLALATDLAKVAARALDEYAATAAASAWAELFADFVSTVSRELRDAITAMFTRLFMIELAGPSDNVAEIRRIAERMRETLQRLDRAVPPPPPRPLDESVDLAAIAVESMRSVAPRLAPGTSIFEQLTDVAIVRGDPHRLREALRGVAEHVAATAPAGALLCVRVEQSSTEIVVTLSRTGEGYGTDEARHLFDALWQGRDTARALTIARAVFEAHGGRAWVETAEHSGVAYCFALPYDAEATVA